MGRWKCFLAGVALLIGFAAVVAANAAPKDERWLRVSTAEFAVVTMLREKEAVAWAAEFSQYVAALRSFFNTAGRNLPRLTVVVFARERDFDRYRPLSSEGKPQQMAAFFLQHGTWSVAGLFGSSIEEEMRRTIFHEGLHWFLSTVENPNPVWIEEGLAEVFSTFEISKGQATWGRAIDGHIALLRYQGLLPLERLIFTGRDELFGQDLSHTGMVYAQSWVLAHFLIFGQHDIPRNAIVDYAELMHAAIGPDEAFRRAFGKSYGEMNALLQRYIRSGSYFVRRRPLAGFAAPRVEPAKALEVEDALGRLALAGRRWQLAATHARAAIVADVGDPRGHEVLALALLEGGQEKAALPVFERAEVLGSKDAQTFFELAADEQRSAAGSMGEMLGLEPAAARRVANRYERAINLNPRFHLAYQNLAGVIGIAEPWDEQDRRFLELGRKLWPRDAMIQAGFATLLRRGGDRMAARTLLAEVIASTSSEGSGARAYARRLDDSWEQQDIMEEVNGLLGAQKYSEAIKAIDEHVDHGVAAPLRAQLVSLRGPLKASALAQKIDEALRGQNWGESRLLIAELIASDAPESLKSQVRRSLQDLDRQRLGLEPDAR